MVALSVILFPPLLIAFLLVMERVEEPLRRPASSREVSEFLNTATAGEVFDLLRQINQERGVTIVVVTHDPLVADHVDRTVAIRDGRTSSDVLRRTELDETGSHRVVAEEFAVLDRVGRLQLPHDYVEALELERRVRLTLDEDHINVWPDDNAERSRGGD